MKSYEQGCALTAAPTIAEELNGISAAQLRADGRAAQRTRRGSGPAASPDWYGREAEEPDVSTLDKPACTPADAELFYAPNHYELRQDKDRRETMAKAICRICPVRATCLDEAITSGNWHGIWGGLNEEERRGLSRRAS